MSQYAFHFDGTRCTGCKTCEFACKDFRDLQVGFAYRKVYEVTYGETTKDSNGCFATSCTSYPLSLACNHCDDPACTHVCPTGAMHKDAETGLVSVDAEKCVGCGPGPRARFRHRGGHGCEGRAGCHRAASRAVVHESEPVRQAFR